MLSSNAALRPCVRLLSPRASSLIPPTTRSTVTPVLKCLAPQRSQSHLRRLLAKPGSIPSKPSRQSRAHSSPSLRDSASETASPVVLARLSTPRTQSSQNHHDRRSFLRWAKNTGLSEASTYYIGTLYEYTVKEALKKKNFALTRCGGPNDLGIDLTGTWTLPSPAEPLQVLIQCKAGRPSADTARGLEGACSGGRPEWRGEGVMAWLASPKPATKSTWQAIQRSPRPMGFMRISKEGLIQDVLWNDKADKAGLRGLSKKDFYKPIKDAAGRTKRPKRIVEFIFDVIEFICKLAAIIVVLCCLFAFLLAGVIATFFAVLASIGLTVKIVKDSAEFISSEREKEQNKLNDAVEWISGSSEKKHSKNRWSWYWSSEQ